VLAGVDELSTNRNGELSFNVTLQCQHSSGPLLVFSQGALTMSEVHCRRCWQPMPSVALRCPRCGDVDQFRVRRGVAKLMVFLVVTAIALIGLYYFSKR